MPHSASLQEAELSLRVFEPATVTEVVSVISHLKNSRSSGWDGVNYKTILLSHIEYNMVQANV